MAARVLADLKSLPDFVGREVSVTDWLAVTQERISQFAEVTDDLQWIHNDPERAARESPYGTTVAHGFLTLSLLSHFLREGMQISGIRMAVNYGLNRVRFPAPVLAGAKIRARITLAAFKELSDGKEATWAITMETENAQKPCCVAEWVVRYYH